MPDGLSLNYLRDQKNLDAVGGLVCVQPLTFGDKWWDSPQIKSLFHFTVYMALVESILLFTKIIWTSQEQNLPWLLNQRSSMQCGGRERLQVVMQWFWDRRLSTRDKFMGDWMESWCGSVNQYCLGQAGTINITVSLSLFSFLIALRMRRTGGNAYSRWLEQGRRKATMMEPRRWPALKQNLLHLLSRSVYYRVYSLVEDLLKNVLPFWPLVVSMKSLLKAYMIVFLTPTRWKAFSEMLFFKQKFLKRNTSGPSWGKTQQ